MTTETAVIHTTAGMIVAAALFTAATAHPTAAQQTAATPERAVQQLLAARGLGYAGDCASSTAPPDDGRWCVRLVASQAERRAYLVGPTGAAASHWLFVELVGPGWQPCALVPRDPLDPGGAIPWPV